MNKHQYGIIFTLAFSLGTACSDGQEDPTDVLAQQATVDNGLSLNGLSWNGLSWNGLSWNGLSWNGLSWNGLSSPFFASWFLDEHTGPAYSAMLMKYIVRCAVPAGVSRSATINGISYSWQGQLGLAPQWTAGRPIPLVEQQLITACLAAHINKFGAHVDISVHGYQSDGLAVPSVGHELKDYPVKEGCFFGNLFAGEGIYVGNDSVWAADKSSSRDCAIAVSGQTNNRCPPLVFAGQCGKICVPDGSHTAYYSCTYNGKSYASMNTRITHEVIYQCGDHICQVSERCGTGKTPDNCKDCGPCP